MSQGGLRQRDLSWAIEGDKHVVCDALVNGRSAYRRCLVSSRGPCRCCVVRCVLHAVSEHLTSTGQTRKENWSLQSSDKMRSMAAQGQVVGGREYVCSSTPLYSGHALLHDLACG